MGWRRSGDKPLYEPMMVTDAYMRHSALNELTDWGQSDEYII